MAANEQGSADTSVSIAPSARHARYLALDGLRGLAILLVFIDHIYADLSHLRNSALGGVLALGNGGWIGVDLFFVLSGFLITGILIDTVNRPRYFQNFYVRRALRIFPLFYGVFLLLVVLTPLLHLEWQRGHISYLFYCQNIAMTVNPALLYMAPAVFLGHFWSLAVEEQYYMFWPLAIWILRDDRKIMRLCLLLIACIVLLRFALIYLMPSKMMLDLIYKELPTHGDGLLLGSFLVLALRRWPVEALLRHMHWLVWPALLLFLGVGAYTHSLDFATPAMETVGLMVTLIMFGGLLLRCLIRGSWEERFFTRPSLRFLGRYSYGIYVYHILFWPLMVQGLHWLQVHLHSRIVAGLVYLLLWSFSTVGVAMLSFRFLESPFLRLKERFAPSE